MVVSSCSQACTVPISSPPAISSHFQAKCRGGNPGYMVGGRVYTRRTRAGPGTTPSCIHDAHASDVATSGAGACRGMGAWGPPRRPPPPPVSTASRQLQQTHVLRKMHRGILLDESLCNCVSISTTASPGASPSCLSHHEHPRTTNLPGNHPSNLGLHRRHARRSRRHALHPAGHHR